MNTIADKEKVPPVLQLRGGESNNPVDRAGPIKNVAVLVASCDSYADLWEPFFELFFRYWDDNPYPVYLLSNELRFHHDRVEPILAGRDRGWSANLITALDYLQCEFVLLTLEDLFPTSAVDTERVQKLVAWANERDDAHYIHLVPNPRGDRSIADGVEWIAPGRDYRVSTVFALWRRTSLMKLLHVNESAWQFEQNGTVRSDSMFGFYCVTDSVVSLTNGVIRGNWEPRAHHRIEMMLERKIKTSRRVLAGSALLRHRLLEMRSVLFRALIPRRYQRALKGLLRGE